jgi:membrane fusion protein (multidrug efflux system)
MKILTQLVVVAILAGTGGGAWYYKDRLPFLSTGPAEKGNGGGFGGPVAVEVAPARLGKVTVTVEAVGTARADEAVIITSKVRGLITKIAFREGQRVKAGAVLVQLDASELKAELEEKRAERDNAKRLYDRAQRLLKTRNVSEARVDELTGLLEAAEARVRADEARLAEYIVRAPFSGRLGLRQVSVGALIEPGNQITTLDDVTPIKLDFEVPETALGSLSRNQTVSATSVAVPDRVFAGKVTTIATRVDPVTRSVAVRAEISNDDETLKPGMFLNVILVAEERPNAVLIPEEAVVTSGVSHFVFIIEGDKAVRTEVTLGHRLPGEVEVLAGVEPGVLVVVGGLQKVRDGGPVKLIEPGATS